MEEDMKKYETPYGRKSGLLLALSMDAHCREDSAVNIISEMTKALKKYAPQDATHEGLTNCDLIACANMWLDRRKANVQRTEESFLNT